MGNNEVVSPSQKTGIPLVLGLGGRLITWMAIWYRWIHIIGKVVLIAEELVMIYELKT